MAMMKSKLMAIGRSVIGALVISLCWIDLSQSQKLAVVTPLPSSTSTTTTTTTTPTSQTPTVTTPSKTMMPTPMPSTPAAMPMMTAKTYQATSNTPWGPVTIQVTIQNNAWTKISYLHLPDSPPSQYAGNYLIQQALQAQSASVDGVSGATYTSDAFRDDLKQIITQSKA